MSVTTAATLFMINFIILAPSRRRHSGSGGKAPSAVQFFLNF